MARGGERGTRGEKERGDGAMVEGWEARERGETMGGRRGPRSEGI